MHQHIATPVRCHIRWMIASDMPRVTEIETASFDQAWTEEDFRRHLRQRNCIGMVAECGVQVVGYLVYALEKRRLDLITLAVAPDLRRRGIGRSMIAKLKSKLASHRRVAITIDINERQVAAQLMLRRCEFRAVRSMVGYFGEDDGIRFRYRLPEIPADCRQPQ